MQDITILNRLVTWTDVGIEMEADRRHAELVVRETGVTGAKVTTPIVREPNDLDDEVCEDSLPSDDIPGYRSTTMRVAFLSQDRPDLLTSVRNLTQGLKGPHTRHLTALKRTARYLKYRPRLVQLFPFHHQTVATMEGWTDTNHAGCIRTRKSTSGYSGMIGPCCIRNHCKGQGVIALSSGEAEYYGLTSGISAALGDQSLAADWNVRLKIQIWMDATAGIAIGSRRGLGRVKHIDTVFLWCQEVVNNGRVKVGKKGTKEMLADPMTKPLVEAEMNKHLTTMGFVFKSGRHPLALKA